METPRPANGLHPRGTLLGAAIGVVIGAMAMWAVVAPSDDPCWLHATNVGTRPITVQGLGGKLPLRFARKWVLPIVPQRKEYWGRVLQPGQTGSMPFAPGATISVVDFAGGTGTRHSVWTGTSRSLVAQVNADVATNVVFRVLAQSE